MRIPRRKIPAQPLTFLWERHKHIARCVVAGERPIDIAQKFKITPSRLSIIMSSPAFEKYLSGLRARVEVGLVDIRKEINAGAQKGVQILRGLLDQTEKPIDDSTKFRAKIAQDFLDRDGHGKVQKVQSTNLSVFLTGDRIAELKKRREDILAQSRLTVIEQKA